MRTKRRSKSRLKTIRQGFEALLVGQPRRGKRPGRRMIGSEHLWQYESLEPRIALSVTIGNNLSVGDQLRNYRLAVATTAEYTAFHGGKASAFAEVQKVVTELNEIFNEEFSINFNLASSDTTIFTDTNTDGYTNGDVSEMIGENTAILNAAYGSANYDIGHVFGIGTEGGLAGLGVVNSASKGRGVSTSSDPHSNDPGWIRLVAHEVGHQFGAEHTFNASIVFGGTQQRHGDSAFEPASGTTLMSYAGIASADDNIQGGPDAYFHAASFEQAQVFVDGAGAPTLADTPTGNSIPTIHGGNDFTIPAETPFWLEATGSDPDSSDRVTYTWEQIDAHEAVAQGLPVADTGQNPLFRSHKPSSSPRRVFPRLEDLANNVDTSAIGEALPTTNRSLNFRTTIRDGRGGVASDDVSLTVVDTGAPFAVSSPNGGESITGGTTQSITWDVAGTTAGGINTAMVDIELSLDGGLTYPIDLGTTNNDGSESILIPNLASTEARIRISGNNHIFFDISDANFTIDTAPGAVGFSIIESDGTTIVGEDGLVGGQATDSYTIARNTTDPGTTTIAVNAGTQVEVSSDGGNNYFSSVSVVLTGTIAQTIHVRGLDDTDVEGVQSDFVKHSVTASTDANYSTTTPVPPVDVWIGDDESQPLIGVDLGSGGLLPTNWTQASATFGDTYANLVREDGFVTGVGLTIGVNGAAGINASVPAEVPLHSPSLDGVDGNHIAGESLTLNWTGLSAGMDYNLYMLTSEDFSSVFMQQVTVSGGIGNPLPFTIDTTSIGNSLMVNSGFADKDEPLETNRIVAQADSTGEIRIAVTDTSAGGTGSVVLAAVAIQPVAADTVGFTLVQTGDTTTVNESGTQDTFDVVLTSQPTGNVVIDVASGDTDEATISPSTLSFNSSNWSNPQTVTVTGANDALLDGTQSSISTLSIDQTLTTDNDFDSVASRTVTVLTEDDDAIPLIGVDFEAPASPNSSPTNWNRITTVFNSTHSNLTREDGTSSTVDLEIEVGGSANVQDLGAPGNLPDHTPSLAGLDGIRFASNSITLTWQDLTPGTEYDLWLFVAEPYGPSTNAIQRVTISGGGTDPAPFIQDTSAAGVDSQLLVNSLLADPARTLADDAVRAEADANGEIELAVVNNGGTFVFLIGAAIQEIPTPAIIANLSATTDGNEASPTDVVYTVTLDQTNNTGSAITFDLDDLGTGTATSGSDYSAIAASATISVPDGASTGTFTVPVTDDTLLESTETLTAQISNASHADVTINTSTATANIVDDDTATADLSVTTGGNESGPVDIVFTVTLDKNNHTDSAITFEIDDLLTGTATSGDDYTAIAATAQINVSTGSNTGSLTVAVANDALSESTETVIAQISGASVPDVTIGDNSATATIVDDDPAALTVTIAVASISEADGAGATTATVSRNTDTTSPLVINLDSDDSTEATVTNTVTIPAGQAISPAFDIDAIDDAIVDGTQTVTISASAVGHASGSDTLDVLDGPTVVGRRFFYNDSFFDGNSASLGQSDDGAIATDKVALLPGAVATFVNYTSYVHGINGIMLDVHGLADPGGLSAADFVFRIGKANDVSDWTPAPAPSDLAVRQNTPAAGTTRISIGWPNQSIRNTWLEVTLRATAVTGLASDDKSYYGNAPGESGNSISNTFVDGSDFAGARDNTHNFLNRALVDDRFDYNRDSFVDGTDLAIARDNGTNFLTSLRLISTPAVTGQSIESAVVSAHVAPASAELPLHNGRNRNDVNGNGTVEPVDVLIVLNYLNASESGGAVGGMVDTNGDWRVTPSDALQILNALNKTIAYTPSLSDTPEVSYHHRGSDGDDEQLAHDALFAEWGIASQIN